MSGQAQNDVDLGGQRALVTGGGRGIGRAIAVALAAAGARVAVLARTRSQVQAVATELASHGAQGRAVTADVGDPQQVTEAVAGLEAAWGGIDILVNNAGALGAVGLAHQTDAEAWLQTVRVNLGGCYLCCRAVLPGMIDRGRGSIVNLSGGGAFDPRPRFSAYGAAKAGVVRFTETLAEEVGEHSIRVNAIAPGAVSTEMARQIAEAGERAGAEAEEAQRLIEEGGVPPERAAQLTLFLVSERSAGISGRTLSAVWDDWQHLDPEALMAGEGGTMRRHKP